jgi:hypothetical protein
MSSVTGGVRRLASGRARPRRHVRVGPALALALGLFGAVSTRALSEPLPTTGRPVGPGWRPASFSVGGTSPVFVSTRLANGSTAYVAWIDHTRTELALYPGTAEPAVASPRGLGEVPQGERWRLLATFNGGFKSNANDGGFLVNGTASEPLQRGDGTLVEYRNGSVAILDWEGRTNPRSLVLARQNLPPLVWAGRANPAVSDFRRWGITYGGGAAVWRTAIGVTGHGDLVFAAANGQTAASIATLMVELGAVRAIELDINPQVPTFIGYARRGGRDPTAFVPNPMQRSTRYLTPDSRDFFAVYTRAGGGPFVPFR